MNRQSALLTPSEQALIMIMQDDLPLERRPYAALGRAVGLTEEQVLSVIRRWNDTGILKRVSAVVRHRRAGFAANGMSVWEVPQERIASVGSMMLAHPEVGHCYQRPAGPGWPYNLYAMLHGRTREEVRAAAERISKSVDISRYDILFTVREFKKTSMRFFAEEIPGERVQRGSHQ